MQQAENRALPKNKDFELAFFMEKLKNSSNLLRICISLCYGANTNKDYEILNSPDRACHLAKQVFLCVDNMHLSPYPNQKYFDDILNQFKRTELDQKANKNIL